MNAIPAAAAVTRYAGSMSEMLPRFGVIAVVVAIIVVGMVIYAHSHKSK